ncbi:hypothetical protein E4U60_003503 [Claviceps pazoutovae]|uniref:Uncharacterized protein n=1 Tax=Claviceps pazoutovae TaxID=1649127 RepID=A0A9P7MAD2_9HYPO|nr:hypothetical protein E4U60_003503 [Claviceps pazoutovae]
MPPSKDPPPPLPLAPDRAALSNKIALLLSQRTSLLKSLAPSNTPQYGTGESTPRAATTTTAATAARSRRPLDNDEDLLAIAARPNDGVGYIRPAEGASSSLEDTKLRGRMMLGKRKKGGAGAGAGAGAAAMSQRRIYESESESDEGRGSLGRAKRARVKTSVEGPGKMEAFEKECPASVGIAKQEHDGATKEASESTAPGRAPAVEVVEAVGVGVEAEAEAEAEGVDLEASKRQRKNQNKKRRKKEKKKSDGKAGEAPSGE